MNDPVLLCFGSLDAAVRDALSSIATPLDLALAALLLARERCRAPALTADQIVGALEEAGVAASRKTIVNALARAGGHVTRKTGKDGTVYRLMLLGQKKVQHLLTSGDVQVIHFDGAAPRTARKRMSDLLQVLSGVVRICDPYYGLRSLELLDAVPRTTEVRFLTAKTSEPASKTAPAFKDFYRERPKVQFRLSSQPKDLHDRYILTTDSIVIVGHGLKDVGTRESFVISISAKVAPDLLGSVRQSFDTQWTTATPL